MLSFAIFNQLKCWRDSYKNTLFSYEFSTFVRTDIISVGMMDIYPFKEHWWQYFPNVCFIVLPLFRYVDDWWAERAITQKVLDSWHLKCERTIAEEVQRIKDDLKTISLFEHC